LIDHGFKEGKVVNIENLEKDSPVDVSDLLKQELHTFFSVPLEVGDMVFGTLCCFGEKGQVLKESLDFLRIAGQQIGVSVEKAMLFEQTQQQAEQESLINVISQQIQSTTSIDDALKVTIRELGRALDAKWTSVQLG
jgi:GAF domain-containing protein